MDNPHSEPGRYAANELPPVLKESMQDFLRALRFGLEAFCATGLELDELCPHAFWADSCIDRLVLLSALRDGIVRIDDSDGKRRWKPGPEWANLEKVLLSQPETDAMPSWWEGYYPVTPLPPWVC